MWVFSPFILIQSLKIKVTFASHYFMELPKHLIIEYLYIHQLFSWSMLHFIVKYVRNICQFKLIFQSSTRFYLSLSLYSICILLCGLYKKGDVTGLQCLKEGLEISQSMMYSSSQKVKLTYESKSYGFNAVYWHNCYNRIIQ